MLDTLNVYKFTFASFTYQVSQKNVPLAEVLPSSKGTFFLGHPVHARLFSKYKTPYVSNVAWIEN